MNDFINWLLLMSSIKGNSPQVLMAGQKTMTQNAGSSLRFHSTSFHSGSETGLAAFLGLMAAAVR